MGFLIEDYVAFVDESGNDTFQTISGLFIPARWVRPAYTLLEDVRASEGFKHTDEMRGSVLASGRGFAWNRSEQLVRPNHVPKREHAREVGRDTYTRVLGQIAKLNGLRVLTIGLETQKPADAYRLWFWAMCAGLTAFPEGERPRVSMIVIDGQDIGTLRIHRGVVKDFYRYCTLRQPYIRAGREWFVGGAVLHESHSLPFVQAADLVAHAAFQALYANPDRQFMHGWYEMSFRAIARARNRQIDISDECLRELGRCRTPEILADQIASIRTVP